MSNERAALGKAILDQSRDTPDDFRLGYVLLQGHYARQGQTMPEPMEAAIDAISCVLLHLDGQGLKSFGIARDALDTPVDSHRRSPQDGPERTALGVFVHIGAYLRLNGRELVWAMDKAYDRMIETVVPGALSP